jgi:hypothetical protein
MKKIYLILALAGFVVPVWQLALFASEHGADPLEFGRQIVANHVSAAFGADLVISSVVFWFFMTEERSRTVRHRWLYVVLNLCVGLSFALPLFLFARER